MIELMRHAFRYGDIEWHYFSYGLDIKRFRHSKDFLDDSEFIWKSYVHNTVLADIDKTCILRDKELFGSVVGQLGFKTPRNSVVISSPDDISDFLNALELQQGKKYVLKPADGQCGRGIMLIRCNSHDNYAVNDEPCSRIEAIQLLDSTIGSAKYLAQEAVDQHDDISRIYCESVNTVRLITIYNADTGEVDPLSAVLRVGANGNKVDNWAKGGLAIALDMNTGILSGLGFYKYGNGTKTPTHPDTGIPFSGIKIPYWKEIVNQALSLHRHILPLFIIGWDIAVTKDGPVFIEGNDNMEISINQEVHGGYKQIVDSYFARNLERKLKTKK